MKIRFTASIYIIIKTNYETEQKKRDINTGIHPFFMDLIRIANLFFVFSLIEMVSFFLSPQASFHRA